MIRPHKVSFYLYAESEDEVKEAQDALFDFVLRQYNKGKLVTAKKLKKALDTFGNSPLITNFL